MPVTYTNRKGFTFYLCKGVTKKGKPRYYFAREPKGEPVAQIPQGYHVTESVNGVVSLSKQRAMQILPAEITAVEAAVRRHPEAGNYRVSVRPDRIEVYERVGPDAEDLLKTFGREGALDSELVGRVQHEVERYGQFTPILRIILADSEQRTFRVERMCYLGSVDGWLDMHLTGKVERLLKQVIPRLGTDAFFDLY